MRATDSVSRYIRAIYAPLVGVRVSNQELLDAIALRFEALEVDEVEKKALFDFVRLLLIGHRTRYTQYYDRFCDVASEGVLLAGMPERAARRLGSPVGRTATKMDIGNGGCSASVRTIQ